MKFCKYIIQSENGLHARPAGLLVKAASEFESNIQIYKGEDIASSDEEILKSADAKGLFSLMGLNLKKGDVFTLVANGSDEEEAVLKLEKFISEDLHL